MDNQDVPSLSSSQNTEGDAERSSSDQTPQTCSSPGPLESVDELYASSTSSASPASPKPASPVSQRSIFRPPADSPSPRPPPRTSPARATEDPRSVLFDDHVASAHVPGSLHLAPDSTIERLIERQGAIMLIRQLASDLAHRDRELVSVRRRAEERERALKRMLVEVEVSNANIERRLATATLSREDTNYTENIDEMMQQAMSEEDTFSVVDDSFSERIEWDDGAVDDLITPKATIRARSGARDSDTFSITSAGSMSRRNSTLKGWKEYFWGPKGAQEEYNRGRPASLLAKRRGITSDTFSPPPGLDRNDPDSRASSRAPSIYSPTSPGKQGRAANLQIASAIRGSVSPSTLYTYPHLASDQSHPTPPHFQSASMSHKDGSVDPTDNMARRRTSSTVAAWALRLVAHAPPTDQENQQYNPKSPQQRCVSGPAEPTDRRLSTSSINREDLHRIMAKNTARVQPSSPRRRALSSASNGGAPPAKFFQGIGEVTASGATVGPVEMDTIVPHAVQPPTLLQCWNEYYPTDYLTDRFGFIYNKERRNGTEATGKSKGLKDEEEAERSSFSTSDMEFPATVTTSANTTAASNNTSSEEVNKEGDATDLKTPTKWQELLTRPPSPSVGASNVSPKASLNEPSASRRGSLAKLKPQAISILDKLSTPPPPAFSSAPLALRSPLNSDPTNGTVRILLGQLSDLHDTLQRDRSTKWNEFFRHIRRDREEAPEGSGVGGVGDGELIGISTLGRGGKTRWKEFKSLVFGGIPVAYRWKVWAECSRATALRVPGYYEDLLVNGADDPGVLSQIEMDINRTLTDNIFFRKGPGVGKLKQVLVAYSRRNPAVGYCQGMNMIVASLLLIMPSEEDTFWVLCSIVEKILPKTYFETSLLASRADQQVLKQYVHEILPTLDAHLSRLSVELEALTFQWFLSVFTDCLAAEALFRVWDVILCLVGSPFLFQVALALLKLNEKALLDCNSAAAVYSYLNGEMTHQGISIDGLIRESDAMRHVVKKLDVERRREKAIERELGEMAGNEVAAGEVTAREGSVKSRESVPASEQVVPPKTALLPESVAPPELEVSPEPAASESTVTPAHPLSPETAPIVTEAGSTPPPVVVSEVVETTEPAETADSKPTVVMVDDVGLVAIKSPDVSVSPTSPTPESETEKSESTAISIESSPKPSAATATAAAAAALLSAV